MRDQRTPACPVRGAVALPPPRGDPFPSTPPSNYRNVGFWPSREEDAPQSGDGHTRPARHAAAKTHVTYDVNPDTDTDTDLAESSRRFFWRSVRMVVVGGGVRLLI